VDVVGPELVVGHETHRDGEGRHRVFVDARGVTGCSAAGEHVADVGLVDHDGAAVVFGFGQADVDIDAERFGDLPAQVLAEGAAGHAADDLAEDEAEGDHVIALGGARLPPGLGLSDPGADGVPVESGFGPESFAWTDDTAAVAHHCGDGDVLLAGLCELRPVLCDGGVEVDLTAVGE
jgi:hypothetical protein